MSDVMANGISVTKIHRALEQLLDGYLSEKEESRRDDDKHDIDYWDSACQTIYDVAAALNIPFEEKQDKRRPHEPDSMILLDNVDVQLSDSSAPIRLFQSTTPQPPKSL